MEAFVEAMAEAIIYLQPIELHLLKSPRTHLRQVRTVSD